MSPSALLFPFFFDGGPVVPPTFAVPTLTPFPDADTPVRTPLSRPLVGRRRDSNPSAASCSITSPFGLVFEDEDEASTSCNASGRVSDGGGGAKIESAGPESELS